MFFIHVVEHELDDRGVVVSRASGSCPEHPEGTSVSDGQGARWGRQFGEVVRQHVAGGPVARS
jgi:hypothetical protein